MNHGITPVVCAAVETGIKQGFGEEPAQKFLGLFIRERLFGFLVLDQLDAKEVSSTPNIAHNRNIEEALECCPELGRVFSHVFQYFFLFENLQIFESDCRGHRVSTEGVAVVEGGVALGEGLKKPVAGDHRTDGGITTGHSFGAGDDVGNVVEGITGEHFADAAKGTNNFIADEKHIVLVTNFSNPLEVTGGWGETATGVLNRLEEDRSDSICAFKLDHFFNSVRCPLTKLFFGSPGETHFGGAVIVGVRNAEATGGERFKHCLHCRDSRDCQSTLGGPVIGDKAGNDLVLHGLALEFPVLLGQFESTFHCFTTAGGEEHLVQISRRVVGELVG